MGPPYSLDYADQISVYVGVPTLDVSERVRLSLPPESEMGYGYGGMTCGHAPSEWLYLRPGVPLTPMLGGFSEARRHARKGHGLWEDVHGISDAPGVPAVQGWVSG